MLVSYKWLKELVDIDVPSQELAEKMSTTGIEVEGVESPAAGLSKIVVGEVLSCEDVPETHLRMFVRLTLAKKKLVKSSVVPQMCVLVSRLWWHFQELVSLTTTKSKKGKSVA